MLLSRLYTVLLETETDMTENKNSIFITMYDKNEKYSHFNKLCDQIYNWLYEKYYISSAKSYCKEQILQ